MKRVVVLILTLFVGLALSAPCSDAQSAKNQSAKKSKKKSSIRVAKPSAILFRPTFNLDSNSVGNYFFPANLGATWTVRRITQIFDDSSRLQFADTTISQERVVNDSSRTLQGLPYLICESMTYKPGKMTNMLRAESQYYVDDSIVMAIFNNSVTSAVNHRMLINPLKLGAHWRETTEDTIYARVEAMSEAVTTPMGTYSALVVSTRLGEGELAKYFVKGTGIVKTVFRGIGPGGRGAMVVTNDLVALDRGDESHSIRRFHLAPPLPSLVPHLIKKGKVGK